MANDDQVMGRLESDPTDESDDIASTSDTSSAALTHTTAVGVMHVTPEGVPYWVPDVPDDVKPAIGMTFDNTDVAYEFYKKYAREAGFPSKKSGCNRNKHSQVSRKYLLCAKHGFPTPKTPYDSLPVNGSKTRKTSSQKCGCKAKVILSLDKCTNKYQVKEFVEEHNHDLVHKNDKHFLTSNRRLSYPQKQALHNLSTINIGPNRAFKILKQTCGGFDQVGATKVDCKNFKRDVNKYIGEYDAQMLVDKLKTRKKVFPDFSFEYRQGGENELNCLFWADGEAKRNYIAFGDVVGFDATFRTNT